MKKRLAIIYNRIPIRKVVMTTLLAVLVFGGVTVPNQKQVKAKDCERFFCISVTGVDPEQPQVGDPFTVRIRIEIESNADIDENEEMKVQWGGTNSVFGPRIDILPEEIVKVSSGQTLELQRQYIATAPIFNLDGAEESIRVRLIYPKNRNELDILYGLPPEDSLPISFQERELSENAFVRIIETSGQGERDGFNRGFKANYFPPNSSTPVNSDYGARVQWIFSDEEESGPLNIADYEKFHRFPGPGQYTVTVRIFDVVNTSVPQGDNAPSETITVNVSQVEDDPKNPLDIIFGGLLSIVNAILGILTGIIRWVVLAIGTWIVIPVLEATLRMDAGSIASGPILEGWTFVRDVVNMFFILGLITIGLATMLRIESYNYKKLLVNLILMAMLVNFSLLIGRVIIQILDVAQFTFLPVTKSIQDGSSTGSTGIEGLKIMYRTFATAHVGSIADGFRLATVDTAGALTGTFTLIFQLLLELGVVITFAAIAVFMVIRTVALWILLVLSPLAFGLAVLPATSSLSKKWWQNFFKYALFAPIIAFFLRLSMAVYARGLEIFPQESFWSLGPDQGQDLISKLNVEGLSGASFTDALVLGSVYVMVIAFMWAGLITAKNMGIAGANGIVSLANKGMAAPFVKAWEYPIKGAGGLIARTYSGYMARKIGEKSREKEEAEMIEKKGKLNLRGVEAEEKTALKMLSEARESGDSGDIAVAEQLVKDAQAKVKLVQQRIEDAQERQRKAALESAGFRIASLLDVKVIKKAWAERSAEKERRAYGPASGHMQDTFNRIIPTEWLKMNRLTKGEIGKKTHHGLVAERGVVAEEEETLLKGVRSREDAARTASNAFKSGDKDEIKAALKVLQHGNWQDDYMNIEGLNFSIPEYLDHIVEQMKRNNFSEDEVRLILDDLKETGEASGRIRAYGYTAEDPDGKVRRVNDFSYYNQLNSEDLAQALAQIEERYLLAFEETGDLDAMLAAESFRKGVQSARAGRSLEDIFAESSSSWGTAHDQNIRDAIVARRFMEEAHIKLKRGEAVTHAKNIEAAIFVDQDPVKGWTRQNTLGRLLAREIPPNITASITARIHQSQARLLQGWGATQDGQTGTWQLPDIDLVLNQKERLAEITDPDKKRAIQARVEEHTLALQKIINSQRLNQKFFDAITTSPRLFTDSQRAKFRQEYNDLIKNVDQLRELFNDNRETNKGLHPVPNKDTTGDPNK